MSQSPCYLRNPCPDRSATCHSTCQAFKEWDAKHRAKREEIHKVKQQEFDITTYVVRQKIKIKKRRNLK